MGLHPVAMNLNMLFYNKPQLGQDPAGVHKGEWTLWPFQFSSQTNIQHHKAVVVLMITDT